MKQNSVQNDNQKPGWFIFECVMAVLYLAFASAFLFSQMFSNIGGWIRIALGVLLGLYGVLRVFRAVRKILQRKNIN